MSVVTATISSAGRKMDPRYELLSIDILHEVNRIPRARLTLIDGDAAKRRFAVSDDAFFDLGQPVDIRLRDERQPAGERRVFSGVVVGQSVDAGAARSLLGVELRDEAFRLTQLPRQKVFAGQSDGELIGRLLRANRLQVGTVAATRPVHEEIVQYGCSDWDFLVARAEVNGLLVTVADGRVSAQPATLDAAPKKVFQYGQGEIYSFEIEATGAGQYGEVSGVAWEVAGQKMSPGRKAAERRLAPGDFDGRKLAGVLGGDERVLTGPAAASPDELAGWASATLVRSRLALVRGRISLPGLTTLSLLDVIEIGGVGRHYNGKALLTGIRQRIGDQGWVTDLQFGLAADWIAARPDFAASRAAGLVAPVGGLQIGVVAAFEEDPLKQLRVKVRFPALGDDSPAIWARLASPDAGQGRGWFFRPEPGDEVVLGFFNEDPRQPVVLGALASAANPPPEAYRNPTGENALKGLVTRAGTKIAFADRGSGKAAVEIETAGARRVVLDDDAGIVRVSDGNGHEITLDGQGVRIHSGKALKITASGAVELGSGGDLTIEASGRVIVKGTSVDVQ